MSQFIVPTKEQVSPASQQAFDSLQKALGFVPNLFATMAHSDNGLPRYLAFSSAKSSLSNKEKEVVNLVVSEVNGCEYCLSAHTVLGKMNGFSDEEILELRSGKSENTKIDALVKLSKEITEKKGSVADQTLEAFFQAGYNKGHVVDVIMQIGDKVVTNYLYSISQIPIDFPAAPALNV